MILKKIHLNDITLIYLYIAILKANYANFSLCGIVFGIYGTCMTINLNCTHNLAKQNLRLQDKSKLEWNQEICYYSVVEGQTGYGN